MWSKNTSPNIGLLFYKRLYQEPEIKRHLMLEGNKLIFKVKKDDSEFNVFYKSIYDSEIGSYGISNTKIGNTSFKLFTTYPGLLVGSGYPHNTSSIGDASVGFYFDHTTGLPELPGSSLKGIIRSIFENEKGETDDSALAAFEFIISEILEKNPNSKWGTLKSQISIDKIQLLKNESFGVQESNGIDTFYSVKIDETARGKFMASDYITPHYKNLLRNPDPIQFIKVLPNIPLFFQFQLNESEVISGLTKELKEELYKEIILTIGIGAKTNVGYGQLIPTSLSHSNKDLNSASSLPSINEGIKYENLSVGDELEAFVTSLSSGVTLDLQIKDMNFKPRLLGVSPKQFELNQKIKVKVTSVGKNFRLEYINPE